MTAATPAAVLTDHDGSTAGDLSGFGYGQELHRSIGTYASFAAGFSFVSILTTVFQLFGFGFSFAGPVFFWTWPAIFLGQILVALCFAELAGRYPISGAIRRRSSAASRTAWRRRSRSPTGLCPPSPAVRSRTSRASGAPS